MVIDLGKISSCRKEGLSATDVGEETFSDRRGNLLSKVGNSAPFP